jgi:two-component system nitrogen regulation response regulator GlnG
MPVLLVIDDDPAIRLIFRRAFQDSEVTVECAETAQEGLGAIARHLPDVVLVDIHLPDMEGLALYRKILRIDGRLPVIFITTDGTSDTIIEAMTLGAYDYFQKPLDLPGVRSKLTNAFATRRLMLVPVEMGHAGDEPSDVLIGRSPAMQEVYKAIGRVAPQNLTVLIRGESGTGKELVARAIYQHSRRASGPFLAINCAAIPETLLESELFGHERGAFTGADRRRVGKFEQCSGGTLFLDEIGDMPLLLQAKMLRVLQERRFERVGGNESIQADVRIIAATHQDLERAIAAGRFRADIYYRLKMFTIDVPPLRVRSGDLPLLVEHLRKRFGRELGLAIERVVPEALDLLSAHRWPGNVRELEGVLMQSMLRATADALTADDLPPDFRIPPRVPTTEVISTDHDLAAFLRGRLDAGSSDVHAESTAFMEKYVIGRVLQQTNGNQTRAAQVLGIARNSLKKKIRLLGITIDRVVRGEDVELGSAEYD